MAIKLYTGPMGSGKTYEVASVVIYNALKMGRRVISNIAGLNYEKYKELILEEDPENTKIGEIVSVSHETILNPAFWLTDYEKKRFFEYDKETGFILVQGHEPLDPNHRIQPGDLFVPDEIWRFWNGFNAKADDGTKRPPEVLNFYRMHRHFVHPDTGITCDVALITQDPLDLSRGVRNVVTEMYRMSKLTALGTDSRYRVDVYGSARTTKEPLRALQRTYNSKYFELYQSHSQKTDDGADAKEINIDKRGNIFGGMLFRVVLPSAMILGIIGFKMLSNFFDPESRDDVAQASENKEETIPTQQTPKIITSTSSPLQANQPQPIVIEQNRRIIGTFTRDGVTFYLVKSSDGTIRHIYNPDVTVYGIDKAISYEGITVNSWDTLHAESSPSNFNPVP